METKCLITKFYAEVTNSRIPAFGEMHFRILPTGDDVTRLGINVPSVNKNFRLVGNGYFTSADGSANYGKTYTISSVSGYVYIKANDECDMFVDHKYEFKALLMGMPIDGHISIEDTKIETNASDVAYIYDGVQQTNIEICNCSGDLSLITKNLIISGRLLLTGNKETDPDDVITNYINSESTAPLSLYNLGNNQFKNPVHTTVFAGASSLNVQRMVKMEGDIKYLADLPSSTFFFEPCKETLEGSINDYVSRAIGNGRTTGSCRIPYIVRYNLITYDGVSVSEIPAVQALSDNKETGFTWDAQGNVTFANLNT